MGEINKDLKVQVPDKYFGERNKLKGFLIQVNLYMTFNGNRFASDTERVLWTVSLLAGDALNWIEGFLQDYMEHTDRYGSTNDNMEDRTMEIFGTWRGFERQIKATFGEVDEVRIAVRALLILRQRGSAAKYTAEFQRYSTKTNWNDDALRDQYYEGLKDLVKDELLRREKPGSLEEMTDMAVEIDNRFYERSLEKKGVYNVKYTKNPKGRDNYAGGRTSNQWRSDPIELDATQRKELSPKDRQRHMDNKTCFTCGKPGHLARNCKGGNRPIRTSGRKELNATNRGGYNGNRQLNATRRVELDHIDKIITATAVLAKGCLC